VRASDFGAGELGPPRLECALAASDCRHFDRGKPKSDHCASSAAEELCGAQGMSESQILNANPLCENFAHNFLTY
jgi:hypothetical protein